MLLKLTLIKNNNKSYTWNIRQEGNLKPFSHNSTFLKSHVQYNARKLFKKLPATIKN